MGFVPYDGSGHASISCQNPAAKVEHDQAEQITESEDLEPEEPELQAGEEVKEAHEPSEMERMATNAGFQNFFQMREATRLQE